MILPKRTWDKDLHGTSLASSPLLGGLVALYRIPGEAKLKRIAIDKPALRPHPPPGDHPLQSMGYAGGKLYWILTNTASNLQHHIGREIPALHQAYRAPLNGR
jgi:hypothetical protein